MPPSAQAGTDEAIIDAPLLHLLMLAESFQTHDALALQRGSDSRQIHTSILTLQQAGCRFEYQPHHGLKLVEAGLPCWSDYLSFALGPSAGSIAIYENTASTQDLARRHLEARGSQARGALFIANQQTAGRGRLGRRWETPAGSALLFSLLCGERSPERLILGASVALCRAITPYLATVGLNAAIKWPNDIFVGGRKIAGILVERVGREAILGIGLNVTLSSRDMPPALRNQATSLHACGIHAHRLLLLAHLLQHLQETLNQSASDPLLTEWRARCIQLHQPVRFHCEGRDYEGVVMDLSPEEGLLLRTQEGELVHLPAATTRTH